MTARALIKPIVATALAAVCVGYAWHVYDQQYGDPTPPKQVINRPNPASNRPSIKPSIAKKPDTRPVVVHRAPIDPFNLNDKPETFRRFEGHTDTVRCVALSADKTRLVTAGNDRTVRLWDFATGKELRSFEGHSAFVTGVDISPDGSRILSCGDDETIRVWDTNTGEQLAQLEGHLWAVLAASFLSDPNLAMSVSEDGTARLWDIDKETTIQTIEFEHSICSAAINLPHHLLAVGTHSGHVYLCDLKTFKKIREVVSIDRCIPQLALSPDAKMLAIGDEKGTCRVINMDTGAKVFQEDETEAGKSFNLAFSSDGNYLALTRHHVLFSIIFYDLKTFQPCKTNITTGQFSPHHLLFVPDSSLLVTVGGGYMYGNREWLPARRDKVLLWNLPNPLP